MSDRGPTTTAGSDVFQRVLLLPEEVLAAEVQPLGHPLLRAGDVVPGRHGADGRLQLTAPLQRLWRRRSFMLGPSVVVPADSASADGSRRRRPFGSRSHRSGRWVTAGWGRLAGVGYVTRGPQDDEDDQDAGQSGEPVEPKRKATPYDVAPAAKLTPPPTASGPAAVPESDETDASGPAEGIDDDDAVDDDDEILEAEIEDVAEGEIEYELDGWATESRSMLTQLLTGGDIAHVWQGGTLVVRSSDEDVVDQYVDHVETTTLPTLDPEAEKIAYEIDDLDDFQQDHLFDLLDGQEIAYEIDAAGELVVLASDEEAVDTVMEAVDFPNALGAGGEDDDELDREGLPVANDVLSDLFVAVDRLQHRATDPKGVLGVVESAEHLPKLRLPYGFDPALWKRIVDDATGLNDLLEDDESQDEDIEEAAARLRRILHEVV